MSINTQFQEKNFDMVIHDNQMKLYWLENDSIKAAFTNYGDRLGWSVGDK